MNVATKVVGALVLVAILIAALFGVANQVIRDSGEQGQDAGNNRSELLGCVARNAGQENPRQWCKENAEFRSEQGEVIHA